MIVAIYVDDLLICGPKKDDIIDFKEKLAERFRITDLGPISYYLGVKIQRDRSNRTMHLSQTTYIKQLVEECGLTNCKPVDTPMQEIDYEPNIFNGEVYEATQEEIREYAHVIGKLQWLANNTRLDIAFATNKLAQFMKNPTPTHSQALKRIVRYLKGTSELGKQFGPNESPEGEPHGYTDAAYGNDVETKRSHSGYFFKLWSGVISHATRRQDGVSTSFTESEYIGQCNAAKEAFFLKQAMTELGEYIEGPVTIYADNQSAMALASNPGNHRRTKHIPIQQHYVRELVEQGHVKFNYVNTTNMAADGLTKPLASVKFKAFVRMLGLVPAPTA